jgi:ABC-2 type transport system permease protein
VYAVLVLAGVLALVLNANLAAYTFEDDDKLLVDLGLSTLFLAGLLLAAFTATSVLSREIENKTVLTVVSKPVGRPAIVIGKYLGVAAALTVAFWTLAAAFLLSVRHRVRPGAEVADAFDLPVLAFALLFGGLAIGAAALLNYLYRRPFPSVLAGSLAIGLTVALGMVWCIDRQWRLQHPLTDWNSQLMIALALVLEAILVLAAVAVAASTRLGQVMTLMVCVAAFLAGLVSEYFLGARMAGAADGPLSLLLRPLYVAVPNLQAFWMADALTQGAAISVRYLLTASLYAAAMIGALVSLAVLLFQRRDVG